jgi:hypothetical protein
MLRGVPPCGEQDCPVRLKVKEKILPFAYYSPGGLLACRQVSIVSHFPSVLNHQVIHGESLSDRGLTHWASLVEHV